MPFFTKQQQNTMGNIGADYQKGAQEITGAIQKGANSLNSGSKPGQIDSFGTMLGKTGSLLSTGLQTAGAVAGSALSPLNRGIQAIAQPIADKFVGSPVGKAITDNKSVQKFAMGLDNKAKLVGNDYNSIKKNHPELFKNAQSALNILGLISANSQFSKAVPDKNFGLSIEPKTYTPAEIGQQIDNHFSTANQLFNDPDMAGKVPLDQLLDRTRINIVDDLNHAGMSTMANQISNLKPNLYQNINDFQSDVKNIVSNSVAKPPTFALPAPEFQSDDQFIDVDSIIGRMTHK